MEKFNFGARLTAARMTAGFTTAKALSEKLGIPQPTYNNYEAGRRNVDDFTLKKISEALHVNFEWLKTGEGHPYLSGPENSQEQSTLSTQINADLLSTILKEMIAIHGPELSKKIIQTIAKDTIGLYTDIIKIASTPGLQLEQVKLAIAIYQRHLN